jgi:hypothetical protein
MTIYIIGLVIALFLVTHDVIEFCEYNNFDYREAFRNDAVLLSIILVALGSWLTIIIMFIDDNDNED